MMPAVNADTYTVRTEALAVRGVGPFRASIRRKSPGDPGLVLGLERLIISIYTYEFLCLIEPEELGDLIASILKLQEAIPEASEKLKSLNARVE